MSTIFNVLLLIVFVWFLIPMWLYIAAKATASGWTRGVELTLTSVLTEQEKELQYVEKQIKKKINERESTRSS